MKLSDFENLSVNNGRFTVVQDMRDLVRQLRELRD